MALRCRVCASSGKRRHAKRKQALSTANHAAKKHNMTLYVYKCPHCNDWHLTHKPQRTSHAETGTMD